MTRQQARAEWRRIMKELRALRKEAGKAKLGGMAGVK
jgi:hypothetical protein